MGHFRLASMRDWLTENAAAPQVSAGLDTTSAEKIAELQAAIERVIRGKS